MRKVIKSRFLGVRLEPSLHRAFIAAARRHGGMSAVLYEMVKAFVENRIHIDPPAQKEMYHVSRSKN